MDTAARIVIRPAEPDGALAPLRAEVRAFLARVVPDRPRPLRAKSWSGFDAEFSLALGAQGWIGMTWPRKFGGQGRSMLERYVVLEELLAAGAPVGWPLGGRAPERAAADALRRSNRRCRDRAAHYPWRGLLLHRHERT